MSRDWMNHNVPFICKQQMWYIFDMYSDKKYMVACVGKNTTILVPALELMKQKKTNLTLHVYQASLSFFHFELESIHVGFALQHDCAVHLFYVLSDVEEGQVHAQLAERIKQK